MTDPPQALYRTFLIFGDQDDTQDKDSKLNGTETECTDWANKHLGLRTFFFPLYIPKFFLGSDIATDGGIFGVHANFWRFENDIGNGNGMETGVLNERSMGDRSIFLEQRTINMILIFLFLFGIWF